MMCIYFSQIEKKEFRFFPLQKAMVLVEHEKVNGSKSGGSTVVTAQKDGNGSAEAK